MKYIRYELVYKKDLYPTEEIPTPSMNEFKENFFEKNPAKASMEQLKQDQSVVKITLRKIVSENLEVWKNPDYINTSTVESQK